MATPRDPARQSTTPGDAPRSPRELLGWWLFASTPVVAIAAPESGVAYGLFVAAWALLGLKLPRGGDGAPPLTPA